MFTVPLLLILAGWAAAKTCTNVTIPIEISSRQGLFKQIPLEGNLDVTTFIQELTTVGRNYSQELLQDYQTVQGKFQISGKFCHPDGGIKSPVVQLLSHGIGFDKTYWDLSYNNYNYSYVEAAIKKGYSTLAIDRFGIGNSSHGDPLNVVQTQAEVEALNSVTLQLRRGQIPGIMKRFEKVIHVGHSFGSVQSYWLSSLYPDNTDGLVLTGWSADPSFVFTTFAGWNLHNARLNQPLRFGNSSSQEAQKQFRSLASSDALVRGVQKLLRSEGIDLSTQDIWNEIATTELADLTTGYNTTVQRLNYPPGYITNSGLTGNQFVFLLSGHFDLNLAILSESTKQPMTVGELLTIGNAPQSTSFTGPVLVITGDHDQPFCGGDCFAAGSRGSASSIPAKAAAAFSKAQPFEVYIQPDTGHGINAHYNATGAYSVIQDFLKTHGLGA